MKQIAQITHVGEIRSSFNNDYSFVFSEHLIDWQRKRSLQDEKVLVRKLKPYKKRQQRKSKWS